MNYSKLNEGLDEYLQKYENILNRQNFFNTKPAKFLYLPKPAKNLFLPQTNIIGHAETMTCRQRGHDPCSR